MVANGPHDAFRCGPFLMRLTEILSILSILSIHDVDSNGRFQESECRDVASRYGVRIRRSDG